MPNLPSRHRGLLPVAGKGQADQAAIAFRAFWNRLAWERSAFANVPNQSAISSKPSSRAVRAMPGYISVYSWVSPATAAARFLSVEPIGRPVAGRFHLRRWSGRRQRMSPWPSTSAFWTKYRYRRLACDSPANAGFRLSSVLLSFRAAIQVAVSFRDDGLGKRR